MDKDYFKKYREEHKEEKAEYNKKYRESHHKEIVEHNKIYYSTPYGRASRIVSGNKYTDSLKGFDTSQNVDAQWIVDNVFSGQQCIYCGESDYRKLGVDRIDNSLPHIPSNLVPCCSRCNNLRSDRRTVEEHIEWTKTNK